MGPFDVAVVRLASSRLLMCSVVWMDSTTQVMQIVADLGAQSHLIDRLRGPRTRHKCPHTDLRPSINGTLLLSSSQQTVYISPEHQLCLNLESAL